jgi:hypothetical protein
MTGLDGSVSYQDLEAVFGENGFIRRSNYEKLPAAQRDQIAEAGVRIVDDAVADMLVPKILGEE